MNIRLFRQSEQAKRDNHPFDVGRDAAETSLSILRVNKKKEKYNEYG